MGLPYENATSGTKAVAEIQKILQSFGAQSFGVMEDFEHGELIAQFQLRKRPITVKASIKGYAALYLKAHPFTGNKGMSRQAYEQKALRIAGTAVYSVLRDWIKGQITAVEIGMLSLESAFLGQIMLPNGRTVLEEITEQKILRLE